MQFYSESGQDEYSQRRLKDAEYQYDSMKTLLEVLRHRCATKCVPLDYGEGDLGKGETECTNRCVAKFMSAHKIIGTWVETNGRLRENDMPVFQLAQSKLNAKTPE